MKDSMSNEPEVEIKETSKTTPGNVQLPVNFNAVGTIENDDVRIYIKQSAYSDIEKLAHSDKTKELGSFLIGYVSEEMGKTHVVISNIIEAKYTDASSSTLTFTHETWEYVHAEQESLYPDKKIIGWQHTHPNYGVFLSNYDMFIQENFFNLPFQVAYVVDPIQDTRAFFQWKNDKVQKSGGFYIYDDLGKTIKADKPRIKKEKLTEKSGSLKKFTIAAVSILLVICAVLAVTIIMISNSQGEYMKKSLETQTILTAKIDQQQTEINEQKAAIDKLETRQASGTVNSADLSAQIKKQQDILDQQEADLDSMNDLLDKVTSKYNGKLVIFTKYKVKKGDSLSSICQAYDLNYVSNRKIILAINGIKNEDHIAAGQTILLPIVSSKNSLNNK